MDEPGTSPDGVNPGDIATVRRLLRATADEAGHWSEPPSKITMFARRRGRRRAVLGAAVAVVAVVGVAVAVPVALTHRRSSAAGLVGPKVTAAVSAVLPGGRWTTLPPAPIVARSPAVTAWTGTQMLVWGGANGNTEYADGAAYNPTTRVWTKLPPSPLAARGGATSVWTGTYLFIWGGGGPDIGRHPDGALYDPTARRWTVLPTAAVTDFSTVNAYWTGRQVLLLSVPGRNANHLVLQAFDPSTRKWARLPDLKLKPEHDGQLAGAVVAGSAFYLWSEWAHTVQDSSNGTSTSYGIDSYAFDLRTRRWAGVRFDPPISRVVSSALWTGREILIPVSDQWCGACKGGLEFQPTGERVDPRHHSVQAIPYSPAASASSFWTGSVLLAPNAYGGAAAYWTPATNRWTALPRAPLAGYGAAVVWTGHSLLVWGQLSPSAHPQAKPTGAGIELGR